ncbi:MAG: hypothetical protein CFE34_12145 [Rhodobacteraceae bacterium PARR1]|nr:MAG: hypothetical protein CFE34_12145 [Rhodobacteraceae bacterium PARR1]
MSLRFALVALATLSACTQSSETGSDGFIKDAVVLTPVFEPPEGYPYPLGDLSGTIGGTAYTLKSYDYSVGAIDPAVWVMEMDDGWQMRATFENATDPGADGPEVTFKAKPPAALAKGMRFLAAVELVQSTGDDEAVLLTSAQPAEVVITDFTEGGSGEYDRITATLTGTLCAPSGGGCVPMALRFETGVYQNDW